MSSSGRPSTATGRELQIVSSATAPAASDRTAISALPPRHPNNSSAIVEYTAPVASQEDEDLEVKLRRIIDLVPVRVNNTSGSSAGSGSGDFHQYRQMRRKEQDRLARMDVDYQKRKEAAEFNKRREERLKATEERTAKKRLKRQKKKQKKQEKKMKLEAGNQEEDRKEVKTSDEDQDSGNDE
uniref:PRKR-interacting protein 1 n=1 Tax=Erigeron canadensis TaxID=72917 RepID=UPI001CB9AA9E|nr:PRKR-interacting protein 1 [Erigeron canadensis]